MENLDRTLGIVITHLPGIADAAGWEVATSWRLTLSVATESTRILRSQLDQVDANHMSLTTSRSQYLYNGVMPTTFDLENMLMASGINLTELTGAGVPDITNPSIMISIS